MTKSDDKRVPALRFKGFTDEWEQRKLGDIFKKDTEKNIQNQFSEKKTISVSSMRFNIHGNGASKESIKKYKILRKGDIAFEGHTNNNFKFGRFVVNDVGDGIMSPRFAALRPLKNENTLFRKYYFHFEPIMRHILVNSTKSGTMMNELVYSDLFKQTINMPQNEEQNKLGALFAKLDEIVELQQRKLNDLKLIRKAVSQTIFPGNNKTESKILVDKTKEVWKKEKAKNIFKEIDIRKVPNNIILSTTQDGRVVTRESLGRNLLFSQDKLKNYKLVKSGQFIIHLRSFKGGFATSNLVGIVSPTYTIFDFKDKDENDSHFWSILFTRYNFIQSLKSVTEGIRYNGVAIKFSQFADLKITYPTLKTQLKISNLFRSLNNDIEKQEFKITKLQELKQFLLQNMFI